MPKAAPTITTTRRVLLAGAGALASAAAALPAGHPDAAMIAAAARVSELDQQIEALTGHLVRIPREIDDLAEVLLDEWWRLLEVVTKGAGQHLAWPARQGCGPGPAAAPEKGRDVLQGRPDWAADVLAGAGPGAVNWEVTFNVAAAAAVGMGEVYSREHATDQANAFMGVTATHAEWTNAWLDMEIALMARWLLDPNTTPPLVFGASWSKERSAYSAVRLAQPTAADYGVVTANLAWEMPPCTQAGLLAKARGLQAALRVLPELCERDGVDVPAFAPRFFENLASRLLGDIVTAVPDSAEQAPASAAPILRLVAKDDPPS